MNDNHLPDDEVLQLVFGELDDSRQAAVRKNVAEDAESAATVRALTAAVTAVRAECVGQVSDDFNDRLRQRMPDIFDRTQAESTRPSFLTRSLFTWRWIMRSQVSRVTAAVVFVLAIGGVAFWFHGGGATPSFADFVEPILKAKTVTYKMTTEIKSPLAATTTSRVMMLSASRSRTETELVMEMGIPNKHKSKTVEIWDGGQGKTLHLDPAQKRARVYNYVNMPKDKTPNRDPLAGFRLMLLDAENRLNVKRESLGEKNIDGRQVVGFRISMPEAVMSVWGDPKTGLPVRVETTSPMTPNAKVTMSDFVFNVDMDESLFSVEPPAGYEVIEIENSTHDGSSPEEKDLIEMFRCYTELSGGTFPDLLDMGSLLQTSMMLEWTSAHVKDQPEQKRAQAWSEAQSKLQRGLRFAFLLPKEADSHYAGKGVSLGAADTPIFWYRPKESKAYRVVYADLSVRDADTPPSVPVAQPGQPEQDLIEMLRNYSELSGGAFPRSLDMVSLLQMFMMKSVIKKYASNSLEQPPEPSAKQEQEVAEAHVRLQRGLKFTGLLPKEADAHYAGKGVSLGAADTPIFWYRPKESKKYRVIYGDLSVRDADTPPSVPDTLPEQDLIDTFRCYSELSGGPFPDLLDMERLLPMVIIKGIKKLTFDTPEETSELSLKQFEESMTTQMMPETLKYVMKFQPGLTFAGSLPPEADAHYAGRGVSLGAPDTPIFWYRPKDSKKCRVIYADLSVRDADTPPSVPDAQPEEDLIDAFRLYSELSGGPFPDSLDERGSIQGLEKIFGLEKGQMPSAKQIPEVMKLGLKLYPGSTFVDSLPPEADAHYAGKDISLGAADKPIFWYRPKDAKQYRVIYADLSVREADTPPSIPNAQPLPAPSSPKE